MNECPLEIDALLLDIPGDEPAGDESAYGYHLRADINELRREELATDFDDATRPEVLKRADWPAILRVCQDALQHEAKDLRLVCNLLEALVKVQGFAGLKDGLLLLTRLIDECWFRLLPPLEENDCEARAVMLENMLDDADRGVLFPNLVRQAPLFGAEEQRYGLADWVRASQMEKSPEKDDIQRALEITPSNWIDSIASTVDACDEQVKTLVKTLEDRMGATAPALTNLRAAIAECRQFVGERLKHHPPVTAGEAQSEAKPGDSASPSGVATESTFSAASINSRLEAYALLARAADALAKIEPHSPTPYLVRRAIELGRLPFPQWISSLMREETVLADLMRGVEHAEAVNSR